MARKVKLRDVTAENWKAVVKLAVAIDQQEFVASNAYSIAQSKFESFVVPKAIYAGKRPVGFIMWEASKVKGKANEYSISRLMIDRHHQRKGYGRAALESAIDEIKNNSRAKRITICYVPENLVSKRFYGSFGFEEVEIDEDGEMIAQLVITKG